MEVKSTVNEVIGIAKEVRGFWAKLAEMFGASAAPVPQGKSPKPVAYVAVDETQVMSDIVTQLTKLFRLEE